MRIRFEPRRRSALALAAAIAFGPLGSPAALAAGAGRSPAQKPEDSKLQVDRQHVADLQYVLDQRYPKIVEKREVAAVLDEIKTLAASADLKLVQMTTDSENMPLGRFSAGAFGPRVVGKYSAVEEFLRDLAQFNRLVVVDEVHAQAFDQGMTEATLHLLIPYTSPAPRGSPPETSVAVEQRIKELEAQIAEIDGLVKRTWAYALLLRSTESNVRPVLPSLRCETIDLKASEMKITGVADNPDLVSEFAKNMELHTDGVRALSLHVQRRERTFEDGRLTSFYAFTLTGAVDARTLPAIDKLTSDARSAPPIKGSPLYAPVPDRPIELLLPSYDQRYSDYRTAIADARRANKPEPSAAGMYLIGELTVTGLYETAAGTGVFVQAAPTGQTLFVEPGTRLYDGEIKSVERLADDSGARIVFRQVHTVVTGDKRSEVVKEVVKTLEPAKAAAPK